jgi:hypothetical protein
MNYSIPFSEQELEEVAALLRADISSRHIELRRTRNPGFRAHVRCRMKLEESVLAKIDQTLGHQRLQGTQDEIESMETHPLPLDLSR